MFEVSTETVKIYVDGITHYVEGLYVFCGLDIYDRSLDSIVKMYTEAVWRDVDCMACLAAEAKNEHRF